MATVCGVPKPWIPAYMRNQEHKKSVASFFLENNGIIEFRVSLASKVIPFKLREKSGVLQLQSQQKFHEFPIPGCIDKLAI